MDWVSIASAAAAWIAAWIAFRSARIAQRAYNIAAEQERRLQPSLELYVVDAQIRRLDGFPSRLYIFRIIVTNKSDATNSLKELKLLIMYRGRSGGPSNVTIPHNRELAQYLPRNFGDPYSIPCTIGSRSVIGGLAIFGVPNDLVRDSIIESHMVTIVDSFGLETAIESILLHEVPDEGIEKNSC
jgi:hypothetical protein